VVITTLSLPGQGLVLPGEGSAEEVANALARGEVTAISCTPSLWRLLLALRGLEEARGWRLRRITLGGERVDQAILDLLQKVYPSARLVHIYATTETGAAIAVDDGRAGFPLGFLDRDLSGGRVRLAIEDGTLRVRSTFRHLDAPEWVDTGDEVEVSGDRVHFLGRRGEDVVNVGGTKVHTAVVEDVVLRIPGIVHTRAYPLRARLMGQLVGLDATLDPALWPEPAQAEAAIRSTCARDLPETHVPRFIRFVDRPSLGANWKPLSGEASDG
jgi:acyl-CoA synthetase (AMP-forming)/AMP-acid ligase II